jgi:hypothetical protein
MRLLVAASVALAVLTLAMSAHAAHRRLAEQHPDLSVDPVYADRTVASPAVSTALKGRIALDEED